MDEVLENIFNPMVTIDGISLEEYDCLNVSDSSGSELYRNSRQLVEC